MKVQYTVRLDVLHAPESAREALLEVQAVPSDKPGVKWEVKVRGNVRDRPGYRTAFWKDLSALRSKGVIFDVVVTDEARQLIQAGKIDPKTHAAIKAPAVAGSVPSEKTRKAQ